MNVTETVKNMENGKYLKDKYIHKVVFGKDFKDEYMCKDYGTIGTFIQDFYYYINVANKDLNKSFDKAFYNIEKLSKHKFIFKSKEEKQKRMRIKQFCEVVFGHKDYCKKYFNLKWYNRNKYVEKYLYPENIESVLNRIDGTNDKLRLLFNVCKFYGVNRTGTYPTFYRLKVDDIKYILKVYNNMKNFLNSKEVVATGGRTCISSNCIVDTEKHNYIIGEYDYKCKDNTIIDLKCTKVKSIKQHLMQTLLYALSIENGFVKEKDELVSYGVNEVGICYPRFGEYYYINLNELPLQDKVKIINDYIIEDKAEQRKKEKEEKRKTNVNNL